MPNTAVHIDFACKAITQLDHPVLNRHVGHVAFGSTSPDIRAITREPRDLYHFAGLDFENVGAGISGLTAAHPDLFDLSRIGEATQAFLAGYVSHLILDETWIAEMYRPFFGNAEVFEDNVLGQVMDRALQIELDRESRPHVLNALEAIDSARTGIDVPFLRPDALHEWCDWVIDRVERPVSMDRLRFMAGRIARWDESHPAYSVAENFLDSLPEGMSELYNRVPREHVDQFKAIAAERVTSVMAEYMQCT